MSAFSNTFSEQYPGATKYFLCGDEKLWFVPEIVALSSEPLAALLSGDFVEKNKQEIEIPKDELHPMILILHSLIPKEPFREINEINVNTVLPVASKYLIKIVIEKCGKILSNKPSTAFEGLCLGIRYQLSSVITECLPLAMLTYDAMGRLEQSGTDVRPNKLNSYLLKCFSTSGGCIWNCNGVVSGKSLFVDVKNYADECHFCKAVVYDHIDSKFTPQFDASSSPMELSVKHKWWIRILPNGIKDPLKYNMRCICCNLCYCESHRINDHCNKLKEVIKNKLPKQPDDWYAV